MISAVFPVYNERENINPLVERLLSVLGRREELFELIGVDDGSRDRSFEELTRIAGREPRLKVIQFSRNFGQTAALAAGIAAARGDVIVTIDSDLENDPEDIPRLLEKLKEGYDVVSGWRQGRWNDRVLARKLPSLIANWLISRIGGLRLHDYGCTLKAYRREAIAGVPLYGEMHRFIPAYLYWKGARVAEIPVKYRPRIHGTSKYGLSRIFRVVLDLLLIKFLTRYMNRPIHFFGGVGLFAFFIGCAAGTGAVMLKIISGRSLIRTPLPILSALFIIVGIQLIIMGVLAEMVMRTYYESQKKTPYHIKGKINI